MHFFVDFSVLPLGSAPKLALNPKGFNPLNPSQKLVAVGMRVQELGPAVEGFRMSDLREGIASTWRVGAYVTSL